MEAGQKRHGAKNNSEEKKEQKAKDDSQRKQKKKGKGKKGKKGKGRGKKSNREASEEDKTALTEFLGSFRGTRRLMVSDKAFCCI